MTKHNNEFNPQQQHTKPPQVDEIARQKQEAEEKEVTGRTRMTVKMTMPATIGNAAYSA